MEALIKDKGNVRLRRINIDQWRSAVATQYGIVSIPRLWMYEGMKRVSTDLRDVWNRLGRL